MTSELEKVSFQIKETIKALNLDKHLVVIIMSLCMGYFAIFMFNRMINIE